MKSQSKLTVKSRWFTFKELIQTLGGVDRERGTSQACWWACLSAEQSGVVVLELHLSFASSRLKRLTSNPLACHLLCTSPKPILCCHYSFERPAGSGIQQCDWGTGIGNSLKALTVVEDHYWVRQQPTVSSCVDQSFAGIVSHT
jgi:hypothetical protein